MTLLSQLERQPARGMASSPAALFIAIPVAVLCVFSQQFPSGPFPTGWLHARLTGGLRITDLIAIVIAALTAFDAMATRRRALYPARLRPPSLLIAVVIVFGVAHGAAAGGSNLVVQWRDMVHGLIFGLAIGRLQAFYAGAKVLVSWLLGVGLAYGGALLLNYFISNGGVIGTATGRVPVFDGPTVSAFGYLAVLGFLVRIARTGAGKFLPTLTLVVATAIVLLSFRRTYWAELGLMSALLLLHTEVMRRRRRSVVVVAALALSVVVAVQGWDRVQARLQSFDPRVANSDAALTNQGHLGDVELAWEQVKRTPILGLGVGVSYDASQLGFKQQSYGVHNGLLTVWLLFGLAGVGAFVWWLTVVIGTLRQRLRRKAMPPDVAALVRATYLWIVAAFGVSLGFSPLPVQASQLAILFGCAVGASVVCVEAETAPAHAD